MGFLDRMVSNAIHRSTGVKAHRVVRKVGAGKLLLMGGAALAGAVAAGKMNQGQGGAAGGSYKTGRAGTSGAGAAPPPPPVPQANPDLPPLPPLPVMAETAPVEAAPAHPTEDDLPQGLVFPLVRTMVAASLADGELAPEERDLIHQQLGEGGLSDEQAAQVRRELVVPASVEELASGATDPEHAPALYRAALLVVKADGEVGDAETRWLSQLGAALGLDEARRKELEDDLLGTLQAES